MTLRHISPATAYRPASRRGCRFATALFLLGLPGGCGVADRFAGRSVSYDVQSESVRNQAILLNIVRAALRKPMMFVDVGAVSGTSSVSGTGTLAAPLWIVNSISGGTGSLSPALTVSGGPTFALTPLVSKEFYQGILSPVPTQVLADLIAYGIPKRLVMLLAIQRIVIAARVGHDYHSYNFSNDLYGSHAEDFSRELDLLIKPGGLTIEVNSSTITLMPPVSGAALLKPKILASLLAADIAVHDVNRENNAALADNEKADLSKAAPGDMFLLKKSRDGAAFCFHPDNPVLAQAWPVPIPRDLDEAIKYSNLTSHSPAKDKIKPLLLSDNYCDTIASFKFDKTTHAVVKQTRSENTASNSSPDGQVAIYIVVRSVQQILYALGEIARAELHLDPDLHLPEGRDDPFHPALADLVRLNTPQSGSIPGEDDIATLYDGKHYWVTTDPQGRDRSTQVIDVVGQMLALNNSAKDLPAPSTLTLIAH